MRIIETASKTNANFPTGKAVKNFDTFEQVKEFAEKWGGEIRVLKSQAGHSYYIAGSLTNKPFDMVEMYDLMEIKTDWRSFDKKEVFVDMCEEISQMHKVEEFETLQTMASNYEELCNAVDDCNEDEFVVWNNELKGKIYFEKINKTTLRYNEDLFYFYEIGVCFDELPDFDEETEQEFYFY